MRYWPRMTSLICLIMFTALALSSGCAEDDTAASFTAEKGDGGEVDYNNDQNVIVTAEGTYIATGDPGEDCIQLEGEDTCVPFDEVKGKFCSDDGAQVDIIVVDGEAQGVICYPSPEDGTPIGEVQIDENGNPIVPQNQNGSVVTFPEDTNGEPLQGDVTIDAERTTLYGNGPDDTIFAGNLSLASNNSRVRGVTVQGNLSYAKNSNNSAAAFCRVHGDLVVESNSFRAVECIVFGDVNISGNSPVLVNIGVAGNWGVPDSAICDGCYSFTDDDEDFLVSDEEKDGGEALSCGGS